MAEWFDNEDHQFSDGEPIMGTGYVPACPMCQWPTSVCQCEKPSLDVKIGKKGSKYFQYDTSAIFDENPKEKHGRVKVPLQLNPPYALEQMAWAHKHGADKYGAWNWRSTHVNLTTYIGAIMRHVAAVQDGEDIDPESGIHHLGHIMACCGVVLDALNKERLNDDRIG